MQTREKRSALNASKSERTFTQGYTWTSGGHGWFLSNSVAQAYSEAVETFMKDHGGANRVCISSGQVCPGRSAAHACKTMCERFTNAQTSCIIWQHQPTTPLRATLGTRADLATGVLLSLLGYDITLLPPAWQRRMQSDAGGPAHPTLHTPSARRTRCLHDTCQHVCWA